MTRPILITRPKSSATNFANLLSDRGIPHTSIYVSPIMAILPVAFKMPHFEVAIFTSAQGVQAFPTGVAHRRAAYCVGEKTTQAAQNAGFEAIYGGGTLDQLKEYLQIHPPKGVVAHFRGAHTIGDLSTSLPHMKDVVIYYQKAQNLTNNAKNLLQRESRVFLPLFSPRSAALVLNQPCNFHTHQAICISPAVADICTQKGMTHIAIAAAPTAWDMANVICDMVRTNVG
ncbi:MAG: uroporphyrinogen-III synthase [Pseudomonadota bacterium]